jgi:hypothetical protein
MNRKTVPPADISSGIPRPNLSAIAPPTDGATVAPMISPANVDSPIAVAENWGGTLSAGTSTMIKEAIACPPLVRNTIPANSQRWA